MIKIEGEITEISCPPNRADTFRIVNIWLNQTEEDMDLTLELEKLKRSKIEVGDKVTIQIDKRFDVDSFTNDLFKNA